MHSFATVVQFAPTARRCVVATRCFVRSVSPAVGMFRAWRDDRLATDPTIRTGPQSRLESSAHSDRRVGGRCQLLLSGGRWSRDPGLQPTLELPTTARSGSVCPGRVPGRACGVRASPTSGSTSGQRRGARRSRTTSRGRRCSRTAVASPSVHHVRPRTRQYSGTISVSCWRCARLSSSLDVLRRPDDPERRLFRCSGVRGRGSYRHMRPRNGRSGRH